MDHRRGFYRLGKFIGRAWPAVILGWVILVIAVRWAAPDWNSITRDGDFEYLPDDSPSVIGQAALDEAFPDALGRSQFVVVVARREGEPGELDLHASYDIARRLHLISGVAAFSRGRARQQRAEELRAEELRPHDRQRAMQLDEQAEQDLAMAGAELDQAVELTRRVLEYLDRLQRDRGDAPPLIDDRQLALAFHNRAQLREHLGLPEDAAADRTVASNLDVEGHWQPGQLYPRAAEGQPIDEMWTWQTDLFGAKMISMRQRLTYARLVILHLPTEFMAMENLELFELIGEEIDSVRAWTRELNDPGLEIQISGSAAVGSDLLLASMESIRNTELYTLVLVVLILLLVYRSPLLIGLPLVTIGVSLLLSISLLAWLTQLDRVPGFSWWDFNVYKNTRVFVVVILVGAGTDFCLFLVARYREELRRSGDTRESIARALEGVGLALVASAMTTIIGLGMMFFAEFGKLRNSGPAIGISLAITLAACLTLAPALLCAAGRWVFWPARESRIKGPMDVDRRSAAHRPSRFWTWVARGVTTRPGLVLIVSFAVILPLAGLGWSRADHVTYDMLQGLDRERPSRQGTDLLRDYFTLGESGPVMIIAEHPERSFIDDQGRIDFEALGEIDRLAEQLVGLEGVVRVRSLVSPLGDRTAQDAGLASQTLRSDPRIRSLFVSGQPELGRRVTRLDVVLSNDTFSIEATGLVNEIEELLEREQRRPESFWQTARFSVAGTTAAIRDLRVVTQADNLRIEILVVVAVYIVLLLILRRPLICLYMIVTVLISFFATLGMTDAFFAWQIGDSYQGLEWKVPLFLFVILVAVGEDYNVYLAARVFEEQRKMGFQQGLRRAVERTGGIISSCGLIMAGTFISMTSGTWGQAIPDDTPVIGGWLPSEGGALLGLVETGFALALGVLLDTFFVRPVMLPAFIALTGRLRKHPKRGEVHRQRDRDV